MGQDEVRMRSGCGQDGVRMGQDGVRMGQDGVRTAPVRGQDVVRMSRMGSGWDRMGQDGVRTGSG